MKERTETAATPWPHETATTAESPEADAAPEPREYFSAPCLAHELADDGTLIERGGDRTPETRPDPDDKALP